jgi:hypothetical protein
MSILCGRRENKKNFSGPRVIIGRLGLYILSGGGALSVNIQSARCRQTQRHQMLLCKHFFFNLARVTSTQYIKVMQQTVKLPQKFALGSMQLMSRNDLIGALLIVH